MHCIKMYLGKYVFHIWEAVQLTQHVVSVSECKWESMDMFKGTLCFYPGNRQIC